MIHNTRNQSSDTTESQKEKKPILMLIFSTASQEYPMYSKQTNLKGIYSWNKMWPLKSLAMLKFESRNSLPAVLFK